MPTYLSDRKLLVRTAWGGWLVVPTYNVDVAIGVSRDGVIEPWTTRLIQELTREGQVVINAGANFGYYSVLCSYIVGARGRVISIEANPYIIPYLMNSCYWSGVVDRMAIYHCAAWHRSGETLNFMFAPAYLGGGNARELWRHDPDPAPVVPTLDAALWDHTTAGLAADATGKIVFGVEKKVPFQVQARTIDDICADIPEAHLIHMDIEGSETFALAGARQLIKRSPHMRIVFEWFASRYQKGTPAVQAGFAELWQWLQAEGFRVRELEQRLAQDGAIYVSAPVTFEYMVQHAAGGDFIALRSGDDPWAS